MIAILHEHSLSVVLLIAWLFTLFWLIHLRKRLRMNVPAAVVISAAHVAVGVFCVKFFAFLEAGAQPDGFNAMSIFGAVFFMPLAYFIAAKLTGRAFADICDICGICTIFTLLCSRFNCLASGCCYGRYMFHTQLRWPTRGAEIVFYAILLIILIPKVLRNEAHGKVYPFYMGTYGIARAVIECFRDKPGEYFFHLTHVWAALAIVAGFAVYFELRKRRMSAKGGTDYYD